MSINPSTLLVCALLGASLWHCDAPQADTVFRLHAAAQSGLDFTNTIRTDSVFNLLDYEYLYNGGGVGIGDFNGDGLPDIVAGGNQVPCKVFLNKGNLVFEDISESSGVDTRGKWSTGIAIADVNQDGLDDIYICTGGPGKTSTFPNLLYINRGDLIFEESAAAYGLDDPSESNQALFVDYDLDGDLDMYLLNGGGFEKSAVAVRPMLRNGSARNNDKLYRNDFDAESGHPVFTDVSLEAGITVEGFGLGVAVLDVNDDQWPDIYVSNDYLSKDLLYLNLQDGTFAERSADFFTHTSHFSMGNDVGDLNNDGWQDLLTMDMLPEDHYRRLTMFGPSQYDKFNLALRYGYGYQYMRNMLHVGRGQGLFSELGQLAGLDRSDWSWAPLIADFNNDGLQDIFITNGYGKNITDLDYVNYRESAITPFAKPEEVRQQLLASAQALNPILLPNYLFVNRGNLQFEKADASWGLSLPTLSNGAAYADLDMDGDLDLVVNNLDQPLSLYENTIVDKKAAAAHFLQVKLEGPKENYQGRGAQIILFTEGEQQTKDLQPIRGFQSSVSALVHFGLGTHMQADSLIVRWPDGRENRLYQVPSDTLLTIKIAEAVSPSAKKSPIRPLFEKVQAIQYVQEEPVQGNDFKIQALLQHGFTCQGPAIAVGDVNNDGLDDLLVGAAYGADATLFVQRADGSFDQSFIPSKEFEDLGALFLDIDRDGDEDLYLASGGSERYEGHTAYQDRIYLNNGRGVFSHDPAALPEMRVSTGVVTAADFDGDGYLDLFVGGRVKPGRFPECPESFLLRNTGGGFEIVTPELCPGLQFPGMLTAAVWTDFNDDKQPDLMLAGEFMSVRLFKNEGSGFTEITETAGLAASQGMWQSITAADFDNDGDTDYVLGNAGENTWLDISESHPLQLHYADFDGNGSVDPLFSHYEEGKYYPLASLDVLAQQLPQIRKDFLKYDTYARSGTADILKALDAQQVNTLSCATTTSMLLKNNGDETFEWIPLPGMAQLAPLKGCLAEDVNLDGWLDLVIAGNEYDTEVVWGIQAASRGLVLLNEGGFRFTPLSPAASGFYGRGDQRGIVRMGWGEDSWLFLLANNKGILENFALAAEKQAVRVAFEKEEVRMMVEMRDGSRQKISCDYGSGYLSQQSKKLRLSTRAMSATFYDGQGKETRKLNFSRK